MRCSLEESLTSGFSLQPFGSAKTLLPLDVVSEHAVQMSLFEKHYSSMYSISKPCFA